jgi:hypothetical protein
MESDDSMLITLKAAHDQKSKFGSECLELLLKNNFMQSSQFLMDEYYPSTNIDTEIIVKSVAKEVAKSQDKILFQIRKKFETTPTIVPVV